MGKHRARPQAARRREAARTGLRSRRRTKWAGHNRACMEPSHSEHGKDMNKYDGAHFQLTFSHISITVSMCNTTGAEQ